MKHIMIGSDFSHHNYGAVSPSYLQFVILKASEGRTYEDQCMPKYLQDMANENPNGVPFIGFYHYARPENNTPDVEAQHYIKTVEHHIGNCFHALDVEGEALKVKNLDQWVLHWCMNVEASTGTKPLIYMSAANCHLCMESLKKYPLWVAHYNVKEPHSKRMTLNPVMWQFTSKPHDMNIFYGNTADMVKLITGK